MERNTHQKLTETIDYSQWTIADESAQFVSSTAHTWNQPWDYCLPQFSLPRLVGKLVATANATHILWRPRARRRPLWLGNYFWYLWMCNLWTRSFILGDPRAMCIVCQTVMCTKRFDVSIQDTRSTGWDNKQPAENILRQNEARYGGSNES